MTSAKGFIAAVFAVFSLVSASFAQVPGPAPEHEKLKAFEGKWDLTIRIAGAPESKGTSTYTSTCGGLWLSSDFTGNLAGLAFEGKGLDGYDPAKKKYVSVWVDSMTPAPMFFEGSYDDSGKVLTMVAEAPGPDGQPAIWKSVTTFKSEDEHEFEMFSSPKGGEESSMMVVIYKRKK
jgi:hypothetical protein